MTHGEFICPDSALPLAPYEGCEPCTADMYFGGPLLQALGSRTSASARRYSRRGRLHDDPGFRTCGRMKVAESAAARSFTTPASASGTRGDNRA